MTTKREFPNVDMAKLKARCTECDGCLLWTGPFENGPKVSVKHRSYKVRLLVWELTHGRAAPRSMIPVPVVCGEEDCIEPTHLKLQKRNADKKGKKISLPIRHKIAMTKRAQVGKIDMDIARVIRQPGMSLVECAKAFNISDTNAHLIRNNLAWIDYSNPYQQLAGAV